MTDENQTELEYVLAKIERGENLTEDEVARFLDEAKPLSEQRVGNLLHVSRDKVLRVIAKTVLLGKMSDKNTIRVFNTLQYACERHDLINAPKKEDIESSVKIEMVFPQLDDT